MYWSRDFLRLNAFARLHGDIHPILGSEALAHGQCISKFKKGPKWANSALCFSKICVRVCILV